MRAVTQLCDQVTAFAHAADEDALDAGDSADEMFDLGGGFCGADAMDVRPGVNRKGDGQAIGAPGAHGLHHGQRRRTPVEERRGAGHHHGVHRQRIFFDHIGQRGEIACQNRSLAAFQSRGRAGDARGLQRTGIGQRVTFVEPVALCADSTMAITSRKSQWSAGARVRPKEQSSSSQASHRTKPPGTLRHAEPEPRRARRESASVESCKPAAAHAATVNAAKAEAEEASPVPAGKLLWEMMRAFRLIEARARTRSRCVETRSRAEAVASASSIVTLSASRSEQNSTVVVVVNAARFIESDELAGRRRALSRLPQYLMSAIFGCAMAVAFRVCIQLVPTRCCCVLHYTARCLSLIALDTTKTAQNSCAAFAQFRLSKRTQIALSVNLHRAGEYPGRHTSLLATENFE